MGLLLSTPEKPSETDKESPVEKTHGDTSINGPLSTPNVKYFGQILDPRSPSANIIRTPIQLITRSADDASFDICTTNDAAVISEAPSSSLAITRTPKTIPTTENSLPKILLNKNLSDVKKMSLPIPKKLIDLPSHVPPKLLESSPYKEVNKIGQTPSRRKSFVGLLETNLDYEETDLDAVFLRKSMCNLCVDIKEDISSKVVDESEVKDTEEMGANKGREIEITEEINDVEPILRKSTAPKEVEEESKTKDVEKSEGASDLPVNISENTTAVIEFNKKVTNLIYTDLNDADIKAHVPMATIKEEPETASKRTPLGVRDCNEKVIRKCIPKLKVRDKPRKSEYAVSKIPVYKSTKLQEQCENTPPQSQTTDKSVTKQKKLPQWDSDNTLII